MHRQSHCDYRNNDYPFLLNRHRLHGPLGLNAHYLPPSPLLALGEDRWLCTLMVQSGWRLDYCAAAEDSTYCPDNFNEFFKQRRRWIPSTLANLLLLISEWKLTVNNNDYISFGFILYQAMMVFSTVIRFVRRLFKR